MHLSYGRNFNVNKKLWETPLTNWLQVTEAENVSLNELVHEIFSIIPSYYDCDEAKAIKELIIQYVRWVNNRL